MKYVIKSATPDGDRYFYMFSKREVQFVTREKYAKHYTSWDSAELMKRDILAYDATLKLTVEEVEPTAEKKCNHDCFNCPFPDCINGRMRRTKWEKAAIADYLTEN
ncbi:MAG: hypothetical protein IJK26_09910 [Clostridia bacterium]|nr:hypothetical protein [Clostridia bacterium]